MNFSLLTQITEATFKKIVFSLFCSHFAVVFLSSSGSHSWSDFCYNYYFFFFFFNWQQSAGYSEHNLNHGLAKDFQADYVSCSCLTQFVCWQHFENNIQSPELPGFFSTGMEHSALASLASGDTCSCFMELNNATESFLKTLVMYTST